MLSAGLVYTELEVFCHFNLNLVNFIFQLCNFVHAKFEVLHSTDFCVIREEITTEQFSENMKTTGLS